MPLFLTDEEFQTCSNDAGLILEKADAFIQNLFIKLNTIKAEADAASTTAEQTCSILEQKYVSLSSDYGKLESENARLIAEVEQRGAELAQVQAEKHQLHLNSIGRDGEFERLMAEVSESQKAKRQMMELVERKELEIGEKNAMIKTYLDKIVSLTENAALKEGKLNEIETELQRTKATCTRYAQEKELVERHNAWINDELTAKVNTLIEIRSAHFELETEMSSKLAQVERLFCERSKSLEWHKERVRELETKLSSLEEELIMSKSSALNDEECFAAERATANKLAELYKGRSEELSKKVGELEGVVLALETRSTLLEKASKEKIEKEISARKELEKDAATFREKLEKCEAEVEAGRKTNELNLMHSGSFENSKESQMLMPKAPAGVSGTALAASILRDGWSLTTIYCKYQEAVDALRHEQLGKKNVEALLERILKELEDKAEAILDERAEHEKILDAYSMIDEKLQHSLSEKSKLEKRILGLQAEIRLKELDYVGAQRDIVDLQKQVTLLLKECCDVQLRCRLKDSSTLLTSDTEVNGGSDTDTLSFNDINGLVEQNVQLRNLVRKLTEEVDHREKELKETFELEIKRHTEEAASRVSTILQRVEEQAQMIESLHTSVAMYKKLYEEEQKWRSSPHSATVAPEGKIKKVASVYQESHAASSKAQDQYDKHTRQLEDELSQIRGELLSIKSDHDKLALEANLARGRLENFMKEFEHQREESNGILVRNIEFSQIIVDYQRKIRESSDMLHVAEDLSRKLTMEMSILKHEKEVLSNAEKRACDEVQSLSERVYRLQASLDTIYCAKEILEEARVIEMKKQEEHKQKIEREWAEAIKELQEERDKSRTLTHERDEAGKNVIRQVENISKELADALKAVTAAEARAEDAEIRYRNLENRIRFTDKPPANCSGDPPAYSFEVTDLYYAKQEIDKLKEEVRATMDHMVQYKNIAQVNEVALRQIEAAHDEYKKEAEKLKCLMEAEISSLRDKIYQLENESVLISKDLASASSSQEGALESVTSELSKLKHEYAAKIYENDEMKVRVSALNEGLEKEYQRCATAQANYERQVILQSETIQELTKTSKELSLLQKEVSELRRVSDVLKSENIEVKQKWEAEKLMLLELKSDAEKKYDEINEQNKILHCRLEALNAQLAEQNRNIPRSTSENSGSNTFGDSGMQTVVSYLRRSKEIAEIEISLLKQEKLRLQSQLESALKAGAASQSSLQAERSRALLLTEDEIKALQMQVREISLLRESNMQLREENKHNFEKCQELCEAIQKNKAYMEHLQSLFREKENELEACRKEVERYKADYSLLEKKASEKSQNIDVNEYNRMKEELSQTQIERHGQMEEIRKLVCEKQDLISRFELDLANTTVELKEKENRINEMLKVEDNVKSDLESQTKFVGQLKKQCGILSKQKEELNRANTALQKQLHEQMGKESGGDEQAMKEKEEKDRRIQILEKTIERFREELHKRREESQVEKEKRTEVEKVVADMGNRASQERIKFVDELEKHKQALKTVLLDVEKAKQTNNSDLEGSPSLQLLTTNTLDESATSFLGSCDELEKVAQSVMDDLEGSSSMATIAAPTTSALSSGPSVNQSTVRTNDEKERRVVMPKPSGEARRPGRRLVRPRLTKQEVPQGDVEMPEVDGTTCVFNQTSAIDAGTKNMSTPIEQPARKRQAALSDPTDLSVVSEETDAALPVPKKSKVSDTHVVIPEETVAGLVIPAVQEQSTAVADVDDDAQTVTDVQADEDLVEHSQREATATTTQDQIQNDDYIVSEETDKQYDTEMTVTDNAQKDQEETRPLPDSDKEEGELLDSEEGIPQVGEGPLEADVVDEVCNRSNDDASNTTVDAEESNQTVAVPVPTTINLNERARIMAQRRQASMISPTVDRRSTGRTGMRGRTPRGRGQTPPGDQS